MSVIADLVKRVEALEKKQAPKKSPTKKETTKKTA